MIDNFIHFGKPLAQLAYRHANVESVSYPVAIPDNAIHGGFAFLG
jgi:hypothetical protein